MHADNEGEPEVRVLSAILIGGLAPSLEVEPRVVIVGRRIRIAGVFDEGVPNARRHARPDINVLVRAVSQLVRVVVDEREGRAVVERKEGCPRGLPLSKHVN